MVAVMTRRAPIAIDPHMTVAQLLDRHPRVARVFLDRRMACVGCSIAAFETLEEVAAVYGEDPERFVEALCRMTAGNQENRKRGT